MADTNLDREATHLDVEPAYRLGLKAGGVINPRRLVDMAADGDVEQAAAGSLNVIGVYLGPEATVAGDRFDIEGGIGWGPQPVVADLPFVLPARLKAGTAGKVVPLVDAGNSGDTIDASTAGGNFGNQPANDGVEAISDAAGDTTQSLTIWYTRNALGDTVYTETVVLTGTTEVVFTHTDIALVLAAELSASCAGTITIREASANATIITLATTVLTAGIEEVAAASQGAWNVAPTAVAGGASTKQVGLIGTAADGTALLDSQALNGATAVTFNSAFRTVTRVLVGDVATATAVTVKVGAEDDPDAKVGIALEAAAAAGDTINALVLLG